MTGPAPTLLRAGRATATAAGILRLRGRRMHVAAVVAVFGDEAGRDGHEAALVQAVIDALAAAPGGATGRMRAAISAADAALRQRAAGRPIGGPPLTAAVSVLAADGDEAVLAEAGEMLAFASTADALPRPVGPPAGAPAASGAAVYPSADAAGSAAGDPNRPPLGRPGYAQPLIRWSRWEPSAFPRGLAILAASRDAADGLSPGVVAALFATPLERWSHALSAALPPAAAAVVLAFPPAAPPPRRAEPAASAAADDGPLPTDTVVLGRLATGAAAGEPAASPIGSPGGASASAVTGAMPADSPSHPSGPARQAGDRPRTGPTIRRVGGPPSSPVGAAAERAAAAARAYAREVPWRAIGARAGRGAARLFLALFPRRLASRDRAEWSQLLATAAILLPLLVLAAAAAVLARQPGGIKAGFDRLGQGGAATGGAIDAAPTPPASAAVAPLSAPGSSAAPTAAVPVATLFARDASLQAGMVRLTDAAGVARVQGAEGDERRVVAVGDTAYVLNLGARVVEAWSTAAVLPVLQSGGTVGGQPVGDLLDMAWLPQAEAAGGQVAVLDARGQLWALDGVAARPLPVTGGLAHGTRAIGGYDGGLYGLDAANGVTRYAAAPGPSFGAGEPWLASAADVATALDIAIDGSVYVLLAGGEIRRYAAGEAAPFNAAAVPGGLAGAVALYAGPAAGRVLVADASAGRFVALAPDGLYQAQYALPILPAAAPDSDDAIGRIRALQGVFWDATKERLWWLSGAELYRATLSR